jgi:hypothetical protein
MNLLLLIRLLILAVTLAAILCPMRIIWLLRKHWQNADSDKAGKALLLAAAIGLTLLAAPFTPKPCQQVLQWLGMALLACQIWLVKPWRIWR